MPTRQKSAEAAPDRGEEAHGLELDLQTQACSLHEKHMDSTQPTSLTATLAELLKLSNGRGTTLNAMLALMADRGVALLMVVCTAPFLIPVSIPGLSTPFAAVLAFCGIFTALARPVRLPQRLGARQLPHSSLVKSVSILERVFGRLERYLHPRLQHLATSRRLLRLHGLYVFGMALVLGIPFPTVPFIGSNSIAAWPIFLLGLGLLEKDGVFVTLAYAWIIPFVAYWVFFYAALYEMWQTLWPHVQGWLAG
jgi:hypothetical protein